MRVCIRDSNISLTVAIQTLVSYTNKRRLAALVAVDVLVFHFLRPWGYDGRLLDPLTRLEVRLVHARCLDREENVRRFVV